MSESFEAFTELEPWATALPSALASSSFIIPLPLEVIYYAIGITGILGNGFTIIVIWYTMDMKKAMTNILILNQSVIDAACGVFLILTTIFDAQDNNMSSSLARIIYCKVWLTKGPLWGCFTSSSFNLIAITIERFVAINHPIWYKTSMTRAKLVTIISLVWFLGNFVMIGYGIASTSINQGICYVYINSSVWGYIVVTLQYFVPIFVYVSFYSRLAVILKRRVTPGAGIPQPQQSRSHNIIMTLIKVVACFVFCWSWNQLYYFLYLLRLIRIDFTSIFYHFTVVLVFCNCCCNPVVYSLSYQSFRVGARKLIRFSHKASNQIIPSSGSADTGTK